MDDREELAEWQNKILDVLAADVGIEDVLSQYKDQASMAEGLTEVLAFRLGAETFGFEITSVTEILRPRQITLLPRAPAFVLGVVGLRGTILPVADTAARLGIGSYKADSNFRIVVVRDGDDTMGFVVDGVVGVMRFASRDIESTTYGESIDPAFLVGIGHDPKRKLVALLSTEKLCDFTVSNS